LSGTGVHKSRGSDLPDELILCSAPKYMWVLNMELALCHPLVAWNFEMASGLSGLKSDLWNICGPPYWDMHHAACVRFPTFEGAFCSLKFSTRCQDSEAHYLNAPLLYRYAFTRHYKSTCIYGFILCCLGPQLIWFNGNAKLF
jgi:hypothetical protein